MRVFFAAIFLCMFSFSAEARPSPYGTTQFSGDRYIARQDVSPRPPARHAARGRAHKARYYYRVRKRHPAPPLTLAQGFRREAARAGTVILGGRPAGRPAAWCGWWLGHHLGMPRRDLWRARNWASVGRNAGGPQIGAVVVWPHHVGIITGRSGSKWVVKSGNDGHAVRERPRSIAGAIAFRFTS